MGSTFLWMPPNWKVYQKRNFVANMMPTPEVMLEFLVVLVARTSPIWWRKKWRKRNRKWIGRETTKKVGRSSSSESNTYTPLYPPTLLCFTVLLFDGAEIALTIIAIQISLFRVIPMCTASQASQPISGPCYRFPYWQFSFLALSHHRPRPLRVVANDVTGQAVSSVSDTFSTDYTLNTLLPEISSRPPMSTS